MQSNGFSNAHLFAFLRHRRGPRKCKENGHFAPSDDQFRRLRRGKGASGLVWAWPPAALAAGWSHFCIRAPQKEWSGMVKIVDFCMFFLQNQGTRPRRFKSGPPYPRYMMCQTPPTCGDLRRISTPKRKAGGLDGLQDPTFWYY